MDKVYNLKYWSDNVWNGKSKYVIAHADFKIVCTHISIDLMSTMFPFLSPKAYLFSTHRARLHVSQTATSYSDIA